MMRRFMFDIAAAAALLLVVTTGWTPAATVTNSQPSDPIAQQIDSKNPVQIEQAVTTVLNQLQSTNTDDRTTAVQGLGQKGHWLAKLMEAQHYEEVARLAQAATLAVPFDFWSVEYVQHYRAQALLALGRPQDALAVAKGLFNVARMKNVAADLAFIVDCLKVTYPCNDAIIDQFRQEEVAGSVFANQISSVGPRSSVLDGITVDGSDYAAAIQQYTGGTNYNSLVSLGNLLLLSDRAAEAHPVFEQAYGLAGTNQLADATESIARCMKAEDGTIGRANAWLLSIRPSASP